MCLTIKVEGNIQRIEIREAFGVCDRTSTPRTPLGGWRTGTGPLSGCQCHPLGEPWALKGKAWMTVKV